jgi:hypothetical protein
MKILEWYDLAAIYFLYSLSQLGAGFGGIPQYDPIVKKDLDKWELWLVRGAFALVFILASSLFWLPSVKA